MYTDAQFCDCLSGCLRELDLIYLSNRCKAEADGSWRYMYRYQCVNIYACSVYTVFFFSPEQLTVPASTVTVTSISLILQVIRTPFNAFVAYYLYRHAESFRQMYGGGGHSERIYSYRLSKTATPDHLRPSSTLPWSTYS